MTRVERERFAVRCGTTLGYLKKVISTRKPLGERICINIDRESEGIVPCESLRSDVDWAYLRGDRRGVILGRQPQYTDAAAAQTSMPGPDARP